MSLSDIGNFCKTMLKNNYTWGRHITEGLTRKMSPKKAKITGGTIDALAGAGLTYYFGLHTLLCVAAIGAAVAGVMTAPATIPAAAVAIGLNVLFAGFGALLTATGLGLLSAAKDKAHIPGPRVAIAGAGHAVSTAAHTAAKPFKWTAHKLSHPFKKANDGGKTPSKTSPTGPRKKPGHYKL